MRRLQFSLIASLALLAGAVGIAPANAVVQHASGIALATPGSLDGSAVSVDCPLAGGCTAAGNYLHTASQKTAVAWSRTGAAWGAPHAVALPVGVPATAWSSYDAVACAAVKTCLLVGTYHSRAAEERAMAVVETRGAFSRAVTLSLPAGERASELFASCPSPQGHCVIVGVMFRGGGTHRLFEIPVSLAAVASHRFGPTTQIPYTAPPGLPSPNNGGNVSAEGFTCVDLLDCIVVGQLSWGSGGSLAFSELYVHGHWGPLRLVHLPSDAVGAVTQNAFLDGVSCASGAVALTTNRCVAVGGYVGTITDAPLVETLSHGAFAPGSAPVTVPATMGHFSAVGCESLHHHCVAVGTLYQFGLAGSEAGQYSLGTTAGFASLSIAPIPVLGAEDLDVPAAVACPPGGSTCQVVGQEMVSPPNPPIALTVP